MQSSVTYPSNRYAVSFVVKRVHLHVKMQFAALLRKAFNIDLIVLILGSKTKRARTKRVAIGPISCHHPSILYPSSRVLINIFLCDPDRLSNCATMDRQSLFRARIFFTKQQLIHIPSCGYEFHQQNALALLNVRSRRRA